MGSTDPQCIFPDYPGTVGWKIGFLALRNAPVGDDGQELNPNLTDPNDPIRYLELGNRQPTSTGSDSIESGGRIFITRSAPTRGERRFSRV